MQRAKTIQVAIDVGSENHWVGIGVSEGEVLEEFEVEHTQRGFENFFRRVERHRRRLKRPVEVAMEGLQRLGQTFGHSDPAAGLSTLER